MAKAKDLRLHGVKFEDVVKKMIATPVPKPAKKSAKKSSHKSGQSFSNN